MDLWKLILDVLKFGAIAVGSVSGLIGTLTETKDKTSGKPTLWGKRIVALIVLSGTIAVTAQSIELYLKRQSDIKEEDARKKAAVDTNNILTNASKAATGIDDAIKQQNKLLAKLQENVEKTDEVRQNAEKFGKELQRQRKSIDKTVAGVGKAARDLNSVLSAQRQTLTGVYRLIHPLGELRVELIVDYPIYSGIGGLEDEWLDGVRATAVPNQAFVGLNNASPLNPTRDRYPSEFALLKQPQFVFTINKSPTQTNGDGKYLIDHGEDLRFATTEPETGLLVYPDRIQQRLKSHTVKAFDNGDVASWTDLYGAEIIITLPEMAPVGSRIIGCNLFFGVGTAESRSVFLTMRDSDRRQNHVNLPFSNISYVRVLLEKDMGPKPDIFR